MGSAYIKRIVIRRAHCDETVEIQWQFNNGEEYIERHTCPPQSVREAREETRKLLVSRGEWLNNQSDNQ